MITREQARNDIVDIIKAGEKTNHSFGVEVEHFLVDRKTLRTYNYYEKKGVREALLQLKTLGWQTNEPDDELMTLRKECCLITLEPAGQIEVSIDPTDNIADLDAQYRLFVNDIKRVIKPSQALVCLGYHPNTKIAELPFIPKERYKHMASYLIEKGRLAHNMMKGSASTQVALDFSSEDDARDKLRMFNALSPFITSFFDTTPYFEGKEVVGSAMRMQIWQETDPERSGVSAAAFNDNFTYSQYADTLLDLPPILVLDGKGGVSASADKKTAQLLNDIPYNADQLRHIMTMYFPDVRLKHFIEVRMADAMAYPQSLGYVEMMQALCYDENLHKHYVVWAKTVTYQEVQALKKAVVKQGRRASFRGATVETFMRDLMADVAIVLPHSRYFKALRDKYCQETPYVEQLLRLDKAALLSEIEVKLDE